MGRVTAGATGRSEPTGDIGHLAVRRKVLTVPQRIDCERIQLAIHHGLGLDYTLGQVIFERVYAANPRTRPILCRPEGVREILGEEVSIGFWKFTKKGHDRFMDRVRRDDLAREDRIVEAKEVQRQLSKFGILRRVGEVLVDLGHVDLATAEEYVRPPVDPSELPTLAFAQIAVQNGFLALREAEDALELADSIQESIGLRLPIGHVFFELGLLRRNEVEAILQAQARIGRLPLSEARLEVLKFSEAEEDVLVRWLLERGAVAESDVEQAADLSTRLSEFGLELGPVEILRMQGRLPEGSVREVAEHQRSVLARLEPEPPAISLSLAPSAEWLAGQGPSDLSEADFLFGQFSVIAGAVNRIEFERAVTILRKSRKELGLDSSLGEVLFDLYRDDPLRMKLLRLAQRDLSQYQGKPYEIAAKRFSPLEIEAASARIAEAALDPELAGELERSERASRALAELGVQRHPIEILYDLGGLGCELVADLVEGTRERDRRIVGGWRQRTEGGAAKTQSLFEMAFSTSLSGAGWGRGTIGSLAVEKGLIAPHQLVQALYVQLRTREIGMVKPFGEILVELGYLSPEQLAPLLTLQARRVVELREDSGTLEDGLEKDDEVLLSRLRATGAVEEERLREILRIRAQLRSMGLKGSLTEILLRHGDLDEEIVAGLLLDARREERTRAIARAAMPGGRAGLTTRLEIRKAYREALAEAGGHPRREVLQRVLRARPAAPLPVYRHPFFVAAASVAFLLTVATSAVLTVPSRGSGTPKIVLRNDGAPESKAAADDAAFALEMARRNRVLVGGRWVEGGAPHAAGTEAVSAEEFRRRFSARLREEGYVEVPGAWLRPDAYTRLVSAKDKGGEGLVRVAGRWRSAESAATNRAASQGAPDVHASVSDFQAALQAESGRTRIVLQFSTELPDQAAYSLVVRAESSDRVLHSIVFRPGRTGRLALEVEPFLGHLPHGAYLLELSYRPEDQVSAVARAAPVAQAVSGAFDVRSAEPVDGREAAHYLRSIEHLAALVAHLREPFVDRDRLTQWARSEGPNVAEMRDALLATAAIGSPAHSRARDRLIGATRRLIECLLRIAEGQPVPPDEVDRIGVGLDAARRELVSG